MLYFLLASKELFQAVGRAIVFGDVQQATIWSGHLGIAKIGSYSINLLKIRA